MHVLFGTLGPINFHDMDKRKKESLEQHEGDFWVIFLSEKYNKIQSAAETDKDVLSLTRYRVKCRLFQKGDSLSNQGSDA